MRAHANNKRAPGIATLIIVCGFLILAGLTPVSAGQLSTATLTASAASGFASCGRWQPIGACFYLVCSLFECHIETTVKYAHYNPDLVISAYNSIGSSADPIGGSPWDFGKKLTGTINTQGASTILKLLKSTFTSIPSGGDFSHSQHQNMLFKEADAIGHPAAAFTDSSLSMICPSDATALKPYFLSGLDAAAWRWQIPEQLYPQSWVPGLREVGSASLYTWGNLYPRSGFSTQTNPAKMAAVISQRVADIVTRKNQPHVYLSIHAGDDDANQHISDDVMVWSPGPIQETDPKNGWWQLVYPQVDQDCTVFGENDLASIIEWESDVTDPDDGSYVWTLWRPYECCTIEGAFITSVDDQSISDSSPLAGGNSPGNLGGTLGNGGGKNPLSSLPSMPKLPKLPFPSF
jgi:integrating conjugative element protein (TIGR03756 family)